MPTTNITEQCTFSAIAHTYDDAAFIEQEIAKRLLSKLTDISLQPKYILDLGCGTGTHCAQLKAIFPNANVIGLDLAFAMVNFASTKNPANYVCANAYALPFARQQFDLIISNCCLPWIAEPNVFFYEILRVLQTNGLFLCSSLGPDSFKELKVQNPLWHDMHILGDALQNIFHDPVLDTEELIFHYPNSELLIEDLQGSGHNLDTNEISATNAQTISIEAVYALAWKKLTKQYIDEQGNAYVNLDCIEHL